jgi:hypothetical protein
MHSLLWKQGPVFLLIVSLVTVPVLQPARAAVIGTQTAIDLQERANRIAQINTVLAREDVRSTLIDLGVSPEDAAARVETMTDAELQVLAAQLDQLPAGGIGIVEVALIATLVIVILELLDVTNLFTKF